MKTTVKRPVEIEIRHVRIQVDVNYDEEDMPNNFPHRRGDIWDITVDVDSGQILDWPEGVSHDLYMKVCDCGHYHLLDQDGVIVAELNGEYVPHSLIPGEYGDYLDFKIDATGKITNWPSEPSIEDFFKDEE